MSEDKQQPQQTLPILPGINLEKVKNTLKSSHDKALSVTSEVTEIAEGDEEQYEYVETLCVRLKKTFDDISYPAYRGVAEPVEGFLEELRDLIAPFDYKSKKDNEYNRLRGLLTAYKQRELNKKKAIEEAAARKRERDNHLVDLKTGILKALNNMVAEKIRKAESGSADYFAATTLDNFDKRADGYMKWTPKLSVEDWEACFNIPKDTFLVVEERDIWLKQLTDQEPFEKYNELVLNGATPIVNAWRAKIPDLKQELVELSKVAADKEASEKLILEQKRKAQQEAARREAEINANAKQAQLDLDTQASMDKMENSFKEQATIQQTPDAGPVKLALKFNDPTKALKAFTTILYHVFAHPEFKGIVKTDAKGVQKVDEEGNPVYIDQVQFFVNFFLAKCDADVEGTTVYEKSKVIIRK